MAPTSTTNRRRKPHRRSPELDRDQRRRTSVSVRRRFTRVASPSAPTEALCHDQRVLLHAQALPNVGDLSANLDAMAATASAALSVRADGWRCSPGSRSPPTSGYASSPEHSPLAAIGPLPRRMRLIGYARSSRRLGSPTSSCTARERGDVVRQRRRRRVPLRRRAHGLDARGSRRCGTGARARRAALHHGRP
jgi:hypothetical protein